jgi:transcriptional regulator with XRE-family HTH domain
VKSRKEKHYDIYEIVAKNIKYYRKNKNMTQAELAEKTEYSHEFIRRIEAPNSKKNFSIDAVSNIADALDINIELLFDKKEKGNNQ